MELQEGADGQVLRHLERGAGPRWLESTLAVAMAKDGALAVVDEPLSTKPRDPATWLHIFSPTGDPLRSRRLPDSVRVDALAFDRGRIALLGGRQLWMLNEQGTLISRSLLPEETVEWGHHVFFSPAGDELWLFPHYRAEMYRFALKP